MIKGVKGKKMKLEKLTYIFKIDDLILPYKVILLWNKECIS